MKISKELFNALLQKARDEARAEIQDEITAHIYIDGPDSDAGKLHLFWWGRISQKLGSGSPLSGRVESAICGRVTSEASDTSAQVDGKGTVLHDVPKVQPPSEGRAQKA